MQVGKIGLGGFCGRAYMHERWSKEFLLKEDPSIEYLELFALVAAVVSWIHNFRNRRIVIFCDNKSVVGMVNSNTTKCRNCMVLIRMLVMKSMMENVRIFGQHLTSSENKLADLLSRNQAEEFKRLRRKDGKPYNRYKTPVPVEMWPVEKIWLK